MDCAVNEFESNAKDRTYGIKHAVCAVLIVRIIIKAVQGT